MEAEKALAEWGEQLTDFHLPRWEELPDLDLYMDQVITLMERHLTPIIMTEKHTILTSSMVNNYVKLGLIPPPVKKRYNRRHLAFLIAITILKQVLTIPEIKEGILFQAKLIGTREAYDVFCQEQEHAIQFAALLAQGKVASPFNEEAIPFGFLAAKTATLSFAMKLLSEKTVTLEQNYFKEEAE